jgi:hypothetical protein
MAVGLAGIAQVVAQEPRDPFGAPAPQQEPQPMGMGVSSAFAPGGAPTPTFGVSSDFVVSNAPRIDGPVPDFRAWGGGHPQKWQIEGTREIGKAAAAFRAAESNEAKATTKKKLVDVLNRYFDLDMKNRATELQKVEERVRKLRALYDSRESKKQEIVDLQVKVLENEAAGLGFFNSPAQGGNVLYAPGAGTGLPPAGPYGVPFPSAPEAGMPGGMSGATTSHDSTTWNSLPNNPPKEPTPAPGFEAPDSAERAPSTGGAPAAENAPGAALQSN